MASEDLLASWERTRGHLARAWIEIPSGDPDPLGLYQDNPLALYQEFLDNNELELAMLTLEDIGEQLGASRAFWEALADAAREMKLGAKATVYSSRPGNDSE